MDRQLKLLIAILHCIQQISGAENLVGIMGLRSRKFRRLTTTQEPPTRPAHHIVPTRKTSSSINGSNAVLQCSFVLLRDALQNNSRACELIQEYRYCLIDGMEVSHRKSIHEGLSKLNYLSKTITKLNGCPDNLTEANPLARSTAQYIDDNICGVNGEISCVLQTLLKIISSHAPECHVVDYLTLCLHETSRDCHKTVSDSPIYTSFTFELKRRCLSYSYKT